MSDKIIYKYWMKLLKYVNFWSFLTRDKNEIDRLFVNFILEFSNWALLKNIERSSYNLLTKEEVNILQRFTTREINSIKQITKEEVKCVYKVINRLSWEPHLKKLMDHGDDTLVIYKMILEYIIDQWNLEIKKEDIRYYHNEFKYITISTFSIVIANVFEFVSFHRKRSFSFDTHIKMFSDIFDFKKWEITIRELLIYFSIVKDCKETSNFILDIIHNLLITEFDMWHFQKKCKDLADYMIDSKRVILRGYRNWESYFWFISDNFYDDYDKYFSKHELQNKEKTIVERYIYEVEKLFHNKFKDISSQFEITPEFRETELRNLLKFILLYKTFDSFKEEDLF